MYKKIMNKTFNVNTANSVTLKNSNNKILLENKKEKETKSTNLTYIKTKWVQEQIDNGNPIYKSLTPIPRNTKSKFKYQKKKVKA